MRESRSGSEAWIAARFDEDLPSEFRLGDGSKPGTGEFKNRPLKDGHEYRVFVRAYTASSVSVKFGWMSCKVIYQ